jgi:hypothetical protein
MSLQFATHGTREGVLKKVTDMASAKLPPGTDEKQVANVAALIAAEIAAMPDGEHNGVRIHTEASCHAGARTIQVTLFPSKLEV